MKGCFRDKRDKALSGKEMNQYERATERDITQRDLVAVG